MESAKCAGVKASYQNGVKAGDNDAHLLIFSAHNPDALRAVVQSHEKYVKLHPDRISDLEYTLAVRREPLAHKTFCVASNSSPDGDLALNPFRKSCNKPRTIWTFTGQGAQWAQMGASLISEDGVFRRTIQGLELALQKCNPPPSWSLLGTAVVPAVVIEYAVR
jgi:acyl transferase domain-containing protein